MSNGSVFGSGVAIPSNLPPAVPQMTAQHEWRTVSPSQIVNYKGCPRKWYNSSILGNRESMRGNQTKGVAIHSALETYMTMGEIMPTVTVPDDQNNDTPTTITTLEYVQAAQKFLPPPRTDRAFWAPHEAEGGGIMVEQ